MKAAVHIGSRARLVALLMALAPLFGCGVVNVRYPDGSNGFMSRASFAAYVEDVFRHHNQVMSEFIELTALDPTLLDDPELQRAEQTMARRCLPLNEAVTADLEGNDLGLFDKLALSEAVPACAQASQRMEQLLEQRQQASAQASVNTKKSPAGTRDSRAVSRFRCSQTCSRTARHARV